MAELDRHEHWRRLAEAVGAELPQESTKPQAAKEIPPLLPVPDRPAAPRIKPPVPRRERHWELVAAELGLPVVEPTPAAAEPAVLEPPVAETQRIRPPPAGPAEEEVVVSEPPKDAPEVQAKAFIEEVASAVDLETLAEVPPSDEAAELGSRRRRRRRGRRRKRDEVEGQPSAVAESRRADMGEPSGEDQGVLDEHTSRAEQRLLKKRRRRRRGSARPGGDQEAAVAVVREPPEQDEGQEPGAEREEMPDGEEGLPPGQRPKHRKIPTWAEATDYIISANLEARAKNPGGGARGRGPKK